MSRRSILTGLILAGLIGVSGWLGWTWCAAPSIPEIALDGIDQELREPVEAAIDKVRRQPRSAEAWGDLSLVLVANGFNEHALPCLAQTERLDPLNPRWPYWRGQLLAADPDQSLALLRRALELATLPEDRAGILVRLVVFLIANGQLDEAAARLEALRAIDGGSAHVSYTLGLLAIARENRAEAREHLSVLVGNPYFRKRACALLATVTDGDAASAYKQQAADAPADLASLITFEVETQAYLVKLFDPLARFNELGREGKVVEALEVLRKAAAASPNDNVCFALGHTLLMMNNLDEAEQHLRQAVHLNPQHAKASLYHGIALLSLGDKRRQEPDGAKKAAELFREAVLAEDRALKRQQHLALAHLTRGRALQRLGQTEDALRSFRDAVSFGPRLADAHLELGEALAAAGHVSEALVHLRNALSVTEPQDPRPRQALEKWREKAALAP